MQVSQVCLGVQCNCCASLRRGIFTTLPHLVKRGDSEWECRQSTLEEGLKLREGFRKQTRNDMATNWRPESIHQ